MSDSSTLRSQTEEGKVKIRSVQNYSEELDLFCSSVKKKLKVGNKTVNHYLQKDVDSFSFILHVNVANSKKKIAKVCTISLCNASIEQLEMFYK